MEFHFNINDIFKEPITEIDQNLLPSDFRGDRRQVWDAIQKVTQVVNAMGEASAAAQGLKKPITTSDRVRNSNNKLYFMVDSAANGGKGAVTGMLKTGNKGLYVFDKEGQYYQVNPKCVLDFYVPETRQRAGYGKMLFQHMLQKEQITPEKMAIDRPNDNLLKFMTKHYNLNEPVKQKNNFVVYNQFFPKTSKANAENKEYYERKLAANGLQYAVTTNPSLYAMEQVAPTNANQDEMMNQENLQDFQEHQQENSLQRAHVVEQNAQQQNQQYVHTNIEPKPAQAQNQQFYIQDNPQQHYMNVQNPGNDTTSYQQKIHQTPQHINNETFLQTDQGQNQQHYNQDIPLNVLQQNYTNLENLGNVPSTYQPENQFIYAVNPTNNATNIAQNQQPYPAATVPQQQNQKPYATASVPQQNYQQQTTTRNIAQNQQSYHTATVTQQNYQQHTTTGNIPQQQSYPTAAVSQQNYRQQNQQLVAPTASETLNYADVPISNIAQGQNQQVYHHENMMPLPQQSYMNVQNPTNVTNYQQQNQQPVYANPVNTSSTIVQQQPQLVQQNQGTYLQGNLPQQVYTNLQNPNNVTTDYYQQNQQVVQNDQYYNQVNPPQLVNIQNQATLRPIPTQQPDHQRVHFNDVPQTQSAPAFNKQQPSHQPAHPNVQTVQSQQIPSGYDTTTTQSVPNVQASQSQPNTANQNVVDSGDEGDRSRLPGRINLGSAAPSRVSSNVGVPPQAASADPSRHVMNVPQQCPMRVPATSSGDGQRATQRSVHTLPSVNEDCRGTSDTANRKETPQIVQENFRPDRLMHEDGSLRFGYPPQKSRRAN